MGNFFILVHLIKVQHTIFLMSYLHSVTSPFCKFLLGSFSIVHKHIVYTSFWDTVCIHPKIDYFHMLNEFSNGGMIGLDTL